MSAANDWSIRPNVADAAARKGRRIPTLALDTAEACRALGVADNTLRDMIAGGIVPAVRIGRRVLIPVDALRQRLSDLALTTAQSKSRRGAGGTDDGLNAPPTGKEGGRDDDR